MVTDAGVELSHAEFGAFFYNVIRDTGEAYTLYSLSGVPREAFEKFPMPRNTALFGATFSERWRSTTSSTAHSNISAATRRVFSATSLDAIVAGADVTKGALYHHFSGKQAIFEAAFERIESRATASIGRATEGRSDPWEKARAGLHAFLEAVQEPGYRQVVISDGPSVLGHERFREQEERSTYAIVD